MALITLGANSGKGKVLQVVSSSNAGNSTNTTSISYVDTVNTLNITPLSSNSKIVIVADHAISIDANSQQRADIRIRETVTSTTITDKRYIGQDGAGGTQSNRSIALCGVLTNSSTAQKTFKVQVRKADGQSSEAGNIGLNWYNNATHSMIALEIAG